MARLMVHPWALVAATKAGVPATRTTSLCHHVEATVTEMAAIVVDMEGAEEEGVVAAAAAIPKTEGESDRTMEVGTVGMTNLEVVQGTDATARTQSYLVRHPLTLLIIAIIDGEFW